MAATPSTRRRLDGVHPTLVDSHRKMLIAGWGRCGIPVAQATRSYHMLVDESYGRSSGECAGTGLNREAKDPAARRKLWDDLTELTGASYPT